MGLVRIAVRIALVQALKGRTSVGNKVLDSQIGLLETKADNTLRTERDAPWIAVYTDAASTEGFEVAGSRQFAQSGETVILIEAGVTAAHVITNDETGEKAVFQGIPATDAAFEFRLDLTFGEIIAVLGDPANAWAEVFRDLVNRIVRIDRARIDSAEGTKVAAHQMRIIADLVAEPMRRQELRQGSAMARFFEMAETIEHAPTQAMVARMAAHLAGDDTETEAIMRRYGMTSGEADALLLSTVPGADADGTIADVTVLPAEIAP